MGRQTVQLRRGQLGLLLRRIHPGILQLLPVRQITQGLQAERHQEGFGGDEGVGRAAAGGAGAGGDEVPRVQTADQVAADLLAEDLLQPVTGDRLVIGDGGKDRDIDTRADPALVRRDPSAARMAGA